MARFKTPQSLQDLHGRDQSSRLSGLVQHAERISRWDEQIQPRLPDRLRHQLKLLNLRHGIAVFGCRDGLGHHLIRWHERQLLALTKTVTGQDVKRVIAQIWRDPMHDLAEPAKHQRRVSASAANYLAQIAEHEQDPDWKALLTRLSKRR